MNTNNYIDLSILPESPSANAKTFVGVDVDGDVIKAVNDFATSEDFTTIDKKLEAEISRSKQEDSALKDSISSTNEKVEANTASIATLEANKLDKTEAMDTYQPKGDYATNEALNQGLSAKQNTLVSGENIKTINGESVLGGGNIYIKADGKKQVDVIPTMETQVEDTVQIIVDESDDVVDGYALPEVPNDGQVYVRQYGYWRSKDFSKYLTETQLNEGLATKQDKGDYVTNDELNQKGYITSIPEEYVTETELTNKGYLTEIPAEYVTDGELAQELSTKQDAGDYATNAQLTEGLSTKQDTLTIDSELSATSQNPVQNMVVNQAINDVVDLVNGLSADINNISNLI